MDIVGAVADIFLSILDVILGSISQLIAWLNPCPFPDIIDGLEVSNDGVLERAWGWISAFVDVPMLLSITEMFLLVFGVAWGIMLLWKLVKAR